METTLRIVLLPRRGVALVHCLDGWESSEPNRVLGPQLAHRRDVRDIENGEIAGGSTAEEEADAGIIIGFSRGNDSVGGLLVGGS